MNKNYYEILGVPRDANADAIKAAYRKLAMQYHPDRNPDNKEAEAKFKEINEAHDVLKDPVKRENYNQYGDPNGLSGIGRGTRTYGFRSHDAAHIDDIINEFFRSTSPFGGAGFRTHFKNPDLTLQTSITLEEAFTGTSVNAEYYDPEGNKKSINVNAPAGTQNGMRLRLAGRGLQNNTEVPPGDLYIEVLVKPHHKYKVVGVDLFMTHALSMVDAALGSEVEVPLLCETPVKVTIPAGTQPNQKIRLKGKGMPHIKNPLARGDLYIITNVVIPTNLTESQKETLKTLKGIS